MKTSIPRTGLSSTTKSSRHSGSNVTWARSSPSMNRFMLPPPTNPMLQCRKSFRLGNLRVFTHPRSVAADQECPHSAVDSTGGCNTLETASAEGVLQMKRRPRIHYTESQKALMWERWQERSASVEDRAVPGHHMLTALRSTATGSCPERFMSD